MSNSVNRISKYIIFYFILFVRTIRACEKSPSGRSPRRAPGGKGGFRGSPPENSSKTVLLSEALGELLPEGLSKQTRNQSNINQIIRFRACFDSPSGKNSPRASESPRRIGGLQGISMRIINQYSASFLLLVSPRNQHILLPKVLRYLISVCSPERASTCPENPQKERNPWIVCHVHSCNSYLDSEPPDKRSARLEAPTQFIFKYFSSASTTYLAMISARQRELTRSD